MVLCNIAASSHRKGESAIRNNDKSRVASDQPTTETGGDSNWLRTTDILGDIISGGLVRATAEVKGNLIKALNNLMYWKVTRTGLVTSSRMSDFFQLVHGYTPEVSLQQSLAGLGRSLQLCERPENNHPQIASVCLQSTEVEVRPLPG